MKVNKFMKTTSVYFQTIILKISPSYARKDSYEMQQIEGIKMAKF
jgi:hypothetical protein